MKRTRIRAVAFGVVLALAAAVALGGCAAGGNGSGTGGDTGGGGGGTGENEVAMVNNTFQPSRIEIAVGDTVTWRNDDSVQHTVTGDDFDSGVVRAGGRFSQTFDQVGTYDYRCTIHPSMVGQVVVK
jgi:plastocyanin